MNIDKKLSKMEKTDLQEAQYVLKLYETRPRLQAKDTPIKEAELTSFCGLP